MIGSSSAALHGAASWCLVSLLVGVVSVTGCSVSGEPGNETSSEETLEEWKERRMDGLRREWVSLAALHWIEGEEVSLGSDSTNDVVFPSDAPSQIGSVTIRDGRPHFMAQPDVPVTADGERLDSSQLATDAEGDATTLELDRWEWYVIDRDGRLAVRLHDSGLSDAMQEEDLPYYPVDSTWRVDGKFKAYDPVPSFPVPTIMGTLTNLRSPGVAVFEREGEQYRLDVFEGGDDTYFVMFADSTNREHTYRAGRYLYIKQEDGEGNIVLDFNRSYNPPCAFTPYATCPFPPPQNRIATSVDAGEMRYKKDNS